MTYFTALFVHWTGRKGGFSLPSLNKRFIYPLKQTKQESPRGHLAYACKTYFDYKAPLEPSYFRKFIAQYVLTL